MSSITPRIALQCIIGVLVALSGVLSEIVDATTPGVSSFADMHLLFGVMLCLGVISRLWHGLWSRDERRPPDVRAFARQLTRCIYGLLYSLLAVKVLLPLMGGDPTSPESFQPYLASGVAAILLTRGLASTASTSYH